MRIMFEIKTGKWKKRMHNVEVHNLYFLAHTGISRNSGKWVRNVACVGMMVIEIDFKELYQDGFRLLMLFETVE